MSIAPTIGSLLHWFSTLKFKIIAMAVVTGLLSAVGTTHVVLGTTQSDIQRLLLQSDSEIAERTATLLDSKLETLQGALYAMARQIRPAMWYDSVAMARFMQDKLAVGALFDSVLAARSDGVMLTRLVHGEPTDELPDIRDRAYFQQALKTGRPVVSQPLQGQLSKAPTVILAIQVPAPEGKVAGIVAGSLPLQSTSLFSELHPLTGEGGSRTLVMDRAGTLLVHPDPDRVLGRAADEPGLADVFARWHSSGSPIDRQGSATLTQGHLISMAGIPIADWVLVRLTAQEIALQPVTAARAVAWKAAAGVGLLAAILAGLLAWYLTRPISQLRARAEKMLTEVQPSVEDWPRERGEVGELAQAFQQVMWQRQKEQGEMQALLQQLEAVLDHAEIGIALTRNAHFELVSRHFCHVFRCEKQHVVGQPARMIYASDEAYQALSERARPLFLAHGVFAGEVELIRHSGQPFWAHMRGRAVVAGDQSQGTIWTIEDVTEVRKHREQLAWSAHHDALTGLVNRRAFEALLERATEQAAVEPFCALFIDLDHFKPVNDTGGHAAGDALLRNIAHTLTAQVRQTDTVARLGGDEFAVLLSRCPMAQAIEIAEKLRSAVISYSLVWEGQSFGVGASIGLVAVDEAYGSAVDVLRAADTACYAAKQKGRNCVAVHSEQVSALSTGLN